MKYDILKLIKFDHPQFQLLNEPHVFPSKKKNKGLNLFHLYSSMVRFWNKKKKRKKKKVNKNKNIQLKSQHKSGLK